MPAMMALIRSWMGKSIPRSDAKASALRLAGGSTLALSGFRHLFPPATRFSCWFLLARPCRHASAKIGPHEAAICADFTLGNLPTGLVLSHPNSGTGEARRSAMRRRGRAMIGGCVLALAAGTVLAQQAPAPMRIRGQIEKVEGNTLTVKARDAANHIVNVPDTARVT